jgi:hypothetical protein
MLQEGIEAWHGEKENDGGRIVRNIVRGKRGPRDPFHVTFIRYALGKAWER